MAGLYEEAKPVPPSNDSERGPVEDDELESEDETIDIKETPASDDEGDEDKTTGDPT